MKFLVRCILIPVAVVFIPAGVIATLGRELGNAFHYTWLDFLIRCEDLAHAWRDAGK